MTTKLIATLLAAAAGLSAALTAEQKEADFRSLANMLAKNYAPYEWKRDALQFDLLRIGDWLRRARATGNDLEFYSLCAEYVSSLQDTHSSFSFPSSFSATLGFHVDIYDGKVVVDQITRARLPAADYPFQVGWEVVSFNGEPVERELARLTRITAGAAPRARLRRAAQRLTAIAQSIDPLLPLRVTSPARIDFEGPDGQKLTLEIPWVTNGIAVTDAGLVPMPTFPAAALPRNAATGPAGSTAGEEEDIVPAWVKPLNELRNETDPADASRDILNYGSLFPIYQLPAGFQTRPGSFFFSGTFSSGGHTIGLLRIPNFTPGATAAALREFDAEIAYFQQNTAGLIIDVSRNNGGDACYNEEIQRRLIPYEFRGMGREIRATTRWLLQFSNALEVARAQNAEPHVIAQLTARLRDMEETFYAQRGRTGPTPICAETLMRQPAPNAFTKPLMVLMDEFSTSAADAFPAIIQDARRGPLFGMRSNGAGGTTGGYTVGVYSEVFASITAAMHHRREPIVTAEYPTSSYVENVGVRPDIPYDYMTRENLAASYGPYTRAFVAAMVEHINRSR